MRHAKWLTENQLDYLQEMMNVGAGYAADVFSQMLRTRIEMKIPVLHALPAAETALAIDDSTRLFACARMELFGDLRGVMYFLVADDQKDVFLNLASMASPAVERRKAFRPALADASVIPEIGSILAGTFLAAVQRFSSLSITHSVPTVATDMYQALLDEDLVSMKEVQADRAIVVENLFIVQDPASSVIRQVKAYLLLIPSPEHVEKLISSIDEARRRATSAR